MATKPLFIPLEKTMLKKFKCKVCGNPFRDLAIKDRKICDDRDCFLKSTKVKRGHAGALAE